MTNILFIRTVFLNRVAVLATVLKRFNCFALAEYSAVEPKQYEEPRTVLEGTNAGDLSLVTLYLPEPFFYACLPALGGVQ